MPESAQATTSVNGDGSDNQTLQAPPGPALVDPQGGKHSILIAGQGDDTFILRDPTDEIQIGSGLSGVKTAVSFSSFVMPTGLQNLQFSGSYAYGVGNAGDNLIIAGDQDGITLYGGAGNDVLVGGLGHDTFVVVAGEGNDVIYGMQARDAISLRGTSFTSFAQVTGAMTQVGADIVLQLDSTETLTIRNEKISDLTAQNFLLKFDPSVLGAMTFDDEFNSLNLYSYATNSGNWRDDFGLSPNDKNNYALFANDEKQAYVSPTFQGKASAPLGLNPFSFDHGVMTITASLLDHDQSYYAYGQPIASGMLNTKDVFEQKYGYFEIKAALPTVAGLWPAFWMIPDTYTGQEADIMESLGQTPLYDYVRADAANSSAPILANALKVGDISGMHTYGMLWTPATVTFYYDGYAVLQAPTPSNWTDPMFMIVNLAAGGWGGQWDPAKLPAGMQIDYIHAYALADGSSVVQHLKPAPSGLTDSANVEGNVAASSNTASQTLTGFAQSGSTVTVYDGTTRLGTTTATANGTFSYTLGQMAVGGHNLTATATDSSGVPGFSSATLSFFVNGSGQSGSSPPPPPPPPPPPGQTYTSPGPGSTFTGTAGNDIFYPSQGNDVLTGGAGSDTFIFQTQPWAPDTITDFTVGSDKLDLSPLFSKYGYTGTDPVKDGWVFLYSDGNGGTIVRFQDHTGSSQWPNTIIDLQHVSPTGLNWSNLSAPASSPPPPPPSPPPPPPASGQTLTATGPDQTLTGGAGDDTLIGGPGNDTLTGAGGSDIFRLPTQPWAPQTITDFTPGVDKLDLSALFARYGYAGTDPIRDGWIFVYDDGHGGSIIRFDDHTGSHQWPNTIIDLQHVTPAHVALTDWILH